MTIEVDLLGDGRKVQVDDRTAQLGGSFYYDPLSPYSPAPLAWAWEQLNRYPKATLLDVGASTGCYSLLAALHPDLTVWAFEPVPLTYHVLNENVRLNGIQDKVNTYPIAVSNYDGTGVAHVVTADGGKGVSIVNGTPAYHKVTEIVPVRVVRLDDFCKKRSIVPTVLKIDVEGSEQLVLEGAAEIIEKYHPFLLFEYSQENADQFGLTMSKTIEMIEAWGYVWSNPEQTDILAVPLNWELLTNVQHIKD